MGETHLKINPKQSLELWKDLSLRLTLIRMGFLKVVSAGGGGGELGGGGGGSN